MRSTIANLERVAQALTALNARQPGFAGGISAHDLVQYNTRWHTDAGPVDILVDAKGPNDTRIRYGDIAPRVAIVDQPDGATIHVAALEDIIVMKAAADRPKDHAVLPTLVAELEHRATEAGIDLDNLPRKSAPTPQPSPPLPPPPVSRPAPPPAPPRRSWWQRLIGSRAAPTGTCGYLMPRARRRCTLPPGHRGRHR